MIKQCFYIIYLKQFKVYWFNSDEFYFKVRKGKKHYKANNKTEAIRKLIKYLNKNDEQLKRVYKIDFCQCKGVQNV
jgi:hypothetical protein